MSLSCMFSSCAWQGYAVTRGVRTVTGARTQVHDIVPVSSPLRTYRVIEAHGLENLLPGRMPPELERYLNDAVAEQLDHVFSSPTIVRPDAGLAVENPVVPDPPVPTLALEGFIDDYDPGYIGLRLVELGFNHMVITVRIQLRDTQTGHILGAASITAQDNRVTATLRGTIGRLAHRIGTLVGAGYARQ